MTTPDPIHPASGDLEAVAMPSDDEIRAAIKATEYKYFGDYEMSVQQFAAVDVLVKVAQSALRPANPPATAAGVGERLKDAIFQTESLVCADDDNHSVYPSTDLIVQALEEAIELAASHDALIARVRILESVLDDITALSKAEWRSPAMLASSPPLNAVAYRAQEIVDKARALLTDLDARDGG